MQATNSNANVKCPSNNQAVQICSSKKCQNQLFIC